MSDAVWTPEKVDDVLRTLQVVAISGRPSQRNEWTARLAALAPEEILLLDSRARRPGWSWSSSPLGAAAEWVDVELNRPDMLAAAIASLHPDGRLRERAVRALATSDCPIALSFLAVRSVDHVQQVRAAACEALLTRTEIAHSQTCFPVLHAVSGRVRGNAVLPDYRRALFDRHGVSAAMALLVNPDPATRRAAYEVVLDRGSIEPETMLGMIESETDQFTKKLLIGRFLRSTSPARVLRRALNGRYVEGRVLALYELGDDDLDKGDVERLMMDSSPRVRGAAQRRARRAGLSPAQFYRGRWDERAREPVAVHVVLDGLRASAIELDPDSWRRCLRSGDRRIRLAALRMKPPQRCETETFVHMLADASPKVVRAAAAALRSEGGRVEYADLDAAATSKQMWTRRAAWRVRRDLGSWDRVRAALELQTDVDLELVVAAANDLQAWVAHGAAKTYSMPSADQRSAIEAALSSAKLEPSLRRWIVFHAGIENADAMTVTSAGR